MEQYLDIATRFAVRNYVWIYFLCLLGVIWYVAELRRARRVLGQARFSLEFETGRRLRNNALFFLVLFFGIAGGVYYLNYTVDPDVREEMLANPVPELAPSILKLTEIAVEVTEDAIARETPLPTPVLIPTITLAPAFQPTTPSEIAAQPAPLDTESDEGTAAELDVTVTLESTVPPPPTVDPSLPTATPAPPTPVPTLSPGECGGQHDISDPWYQKRVSGNVNFVGSADNLDFLYYRLEARGPNTGDQWSNILGQFIYRRVDNALLGSANFTNWVKGSYQIRLVIVDVNSADIASCTTQIIVE